MTRAEQRPSRTAMTAIWSIGILVGVVVAAVTSDVVLGVIAGAPCVAIGVGLLRLWAGDGSPRPRHP
jgi:hypothetical protein